ncbi:MAG: flap endonuclease Xni [Acidobacteriota bacterium]|nr:flap endonuclease Xni [Acidobacteriota bacterium]
MAGQRNTLLLVDALNLIRRIHAAHPGEDGPDRVAGAQASSVQSLRRALRESAPTHAVCVFDGVDHGGGDGKSWRHELYPGYKAGRAAMPEALGSALEGFRLAFRDIGVASLSIPTFEADDVIATAAYKATSAGASAVILSTDKSFLQLLPAGVRVRDHFRRIDFDSDHVEKRFGVRPEQFADFLALAGDRGNGILGVPGIGEKTAAKLLDRFDTLDSILDSVAGRPTDPTPLPEPLEGRLGERLRDHADTARLCRKLVGLRTDLELGTNLSELRYRPPSTESGPLD